MILEIIGITTVVTFLSSVGVVVVYRYDVTVTSPLALLKVLHKVQGSWEICSSSSKMEQVYKEQTET